MSGSEFGPTVETAPEELKLAVHAGGRLVASPPEAISIANRSSLSSLTMSSLGNALLPQA